MKWMRVYLDNCVLNRAFDDQTQPRISKETDAIQLVRKRIQISGLELVWSYLNEFEANRNPFPEIRQSVFEWRQLASIIVPPSISIVKIAYDLREVGLRAVDSLHVASAVEANSDYFVSVDDGILSKVTEYRGLQLLNPITFVAKQEEV